MHTFVETRRAELRGQADEKQRGDILSRLVTAMESDGKLTLDEQEVTGNTFTLLFAGVSTLGREFWASGSRVVCWARCVYFGS
jgi:cytochrome P450